MKADLECSIRQAAIIYFKHMIQDGWMFEEEEKDKKIFISEQGNSYQSYFFKNLEIVSCVIR